MVVTAVEHHGVTKFSTDPLVRITIKIIREAGGNKVFPLIRGYIKLTKKSGQAHEATKFLGDYIEDLIDNNDNNPRKAGKVL